MTAIRIAQDLSATWERARPERRKQLIAELFETIRVGGGRIVAVRPKAAACGHAARCCHGWSN
jgi:translation initiation factor 2B subunit (eIF-2B alpha/beta/delta family)